MKKWSFPTSMSMVEKLESEQAAANLLYERVKQGIRERVDLQLKNLLLDNIKMHNSIMERKQTFEKQVMKDVIMSSKNTFLSFEMIRNIMRNV